jgi:hypothetical protein
VTDCPDDPVSLIAAVPEGAEPAGVTNTWNDGPEAGAGAQLKAQPMFQGAVVVVKAVLVQLPCCCGDRSRTRAGPAAADDEVDDVVDVVVEPPAAVVVVDPPPAAAVVVVAELPPGAVVVVLAPFPPAGRLEELVLGGGSFPELLPLAGDVPPPVSPLIHMPAMTATRATVKSCHVFQVRRSFILSSPGWGWSSDQTTGASASWGGDVIELGKTLMRSQNPQTHHQAEIPFDPALLNAEWDDWALIN